MRPENHQLDVLTSRGGVHAGIKIFFGGGGSVFGGGGVVFHKKNQIFRKGDMEVKKAAERNITRSGPERVPSTHQDGHQPPTHHL